MTRFLLAGAATLGLMTGAAMAQSTTSATSTTGVPGTRVITPRSPPGATTTSMTTGQMLHADGDRSVSAGAGASTDTMSSDIIVTNKTYPFSNLITTTKKTTTVNNGVASESTETTQTYPPMPGFKGSSTTTQTTQTANVGSR